MRIDIHTDYMLVRFQVGLLTSKSIGVRHGRVLVKRYVDPEIVAEWREQDQSGGLDG